MQSVNAALTSLRSCDGDVEMSGGEGRGKGGGGVPLTRTAWAEGGASLPVHLILLFPLKRSHREEQTQSLPLYRASAWGLGECWWWWSWGVEILGSHISLSP